MVIKKNIVRNLLSLEGVCNISRTANVSGGGTSKSKREGDYLHFVQQGCFENTVITTVLNFSVPDVITFLSQTLKKSVSYTGVSIAQIK